MTDLLYTDIEESLRKSVRQTLQRRLAAPGPAALFDNPAGEVHQVWNELAEQIGVAALLVPESAGGAGASAREAAVVLEELGRVAAPTPFLTSAVISTTVMTAAGAEAALRQLAGGSVIATLALPWNARAGAWPSFESGTIAPVAGAVEADLFIVPRDTGHGTELCLYGRAEVEVESLTSLDMTRQLASVRLIGTGEVIASGEGAVEAVEAGLLVGQALLASEQVGIAQWCLESTVEYAKTRIQFARPIGSFQAIKHRLADLYLEVVQAQAAARYAADTISRQDTDRFIAAAVAQSYCSDVAVKAAEEALQLHGGIGMTWEHPIHVYLKRAKSDQLALGIASDHRSDLAKLVDLV